MTKNERKTRTARIANCLQTVGAEMTAVEVRDWLRANGDPACGTHHVSGLAVGLVRQRVIGKRKRCDKEGLNVYWFIVEDASTLGVGLGFAPGYGPPGQRNPERRVL